MKMAIITAISSEKGGQSKSNLTENLGAGIANKGYKVLLLELDGQGSLSLSLDVRNPDITVKDIFTRIINDKEIPEGYGTINLSDTLDILPADRELAALEVSLTNVMSRELVLKDYVTAIADRYDYIFIDCMPSLGLLTLNALSCADRVLIPVQPAYLSIQGLQELIRTIGKVKKHLNEKLTIEGIVFTMVDRRTVNARQVIAAVKESYRDRIPVMKTEIPYSVRAIEANQAAKTIYEYDPNGKVAEAYRALTEEVLLNDSRA